MESLAESMSEALNDYFKIGYFGSKKGRRILAYYARIIKRYAGRDEARYFLRQFEYVRKIRVI